MLSRHPRCPAPDPHHVPHLAVSIKQEANAAVQTSGHDRPAPKRRDQVEPPVMRDVHQLHRKATLL